MVHDRPTPDGSGPDSAWPVRIINTKLRDYVARLNRVWIEGQITELNRRGAGLVFLTLRDPAADVYVPVCLEAVVAARVSPELAPGQHVVMLVQCEYWIRNGRFTLRAMDVRPVGIGVLLAALEARRAALAAEGLFDTARKRPLPLLPKRIGLVTGVNAQALHDVVTNAQRRWPGAQFEVLTGPVQGVEAVASVITRLRRLDADPNVEVIVIARGGGSLEDLLPFSDETLIRAVAAATTPIVSAIGHEKDCPLLDLVADFRASTPTDAGRRVVPDVARERDRITAARSRMDRQLTSRLEQGRIWLDQLRHRPVLSDPGAWLPRQLREVIAARSRADAALIRCLRAEQASLTGQRAHARALSPMATLERGFAVVSEDGGRVLRDAGQSHQGQPLTIRLAHGSLSATVTKLHDSSDPDPTGGRP